MLTLTINGVEKQLDVPKDVPLLWIIREELGLTGTKFGCGKALCGACTVHLGGHAVRSCVIPVGAVVGQNITTIEGILGDDGDPHDIQKIWVEENVPQCGYCQSGQIMSALAMIINNKGDVSDQDIDNMMSGNICRCGTYLRIRKAIRRSADIMKKQMETP